MHATIFLLSACLLTVTVRAQGTVHFTNRGVPAGVDAPVLEVGGLTLAVTGSLYVNLYAGRDLDSLAPVGAPVVLGDWGYFDGGIRSIPTLPPYADGWLQVWAWDVGADGLEDAITTGLRWGRSKPFILLLGEPGLKAPEMVGLEAFTLVPEPGALTLLGAGASILVVGGVIRSWRRCASEFTLHARRGPITDRGPDIAG